MKTKVLDQYEKVAKAIASCCNLWGNRLPELDQLQAYIDSVVAWATGDGVWHVAIERHCRDEMFVLYLLAYIGAEDEHGRYFCHDFLQLLREFAGPHIANMQREVFSRFGIVYRLPPTPKEEREFWEELCM